jgi:hypothetical protein
LKHNLTHVSNFVLKNKHGIIYTFLVFAVSLIFTKYYFLLTNEYYAPAYSSTIAEYKADKVFQKRFLVPVTAKYISAFSFLTFDHSLKSITAISTFTLIASFGFLIKTLNPLIKSNYWSLFILIPVVWNYMVINSIYHAYDIPSLAIFCVGLVLFLKKKYVLFYIVFICGTLNRESTCFITISIILLTCSLSIRKNFHNLIRENRQLIKHTFTQFVLWITITNFVTHMIQSNPGLTYEQTLSMKHFLYNMIMNQPSWPYLNPEDFLENPRCFLTLFAGIWVLIPFVWSYIQLKQKILLLLIPIYLVPAIMYANLMETRVYHEINIIIAIALIDGFTNKTANSSLRPFGS